MRILIVSQMVPYLPCHDGFRLIPAHLLRCLSDRHELHLVALADGGESAWQRQWPRNHCRSVEIVGFEPPRGLAGRLSRWGDALPPKTSAVVRERILRVRPDVLHLEGSVLASFARLAPPGMRRVVSAHDALSLRYRDFARSAPSLRGRALYMLRAWRARRFERSHFRRADAVVVTAQADLEALRPAVSHERLAVIPNGVDLEYWDYRPRPKPGRVVFTGNMSWPPNEDAATYFAQDAFAAVRRSVPQAEFWIVGAEPTARVRQLAGLPGVHVTGTVPDIRPWVQAASVFVSPLRFGSGVKNKILEAMALGAPIVATPPSLTGTPLEPGRHLLLAEGSHELAQAVIRLLQDQGMCRSLSEAARAEVEARYSWESVADRFVSVWRGTGAAAAA